MKDKTFEQKGLIVKILLQMALLTGVCSAALPQYTAWEYLYLDGAVLDVGHYGSPFVTDWDCDGELDLLVGRLNLGCKVDFYKNIGTNSSPQLASRVIMEADGSALFAASC